jgi:hypothetical protein
MTSGFGHVIGKRRMGQRSHRARQKDRREMERLLKFLNSPYVAASDMTEAKLAEKLAEKFSRTFCSAI